MANIKEVLEKCENIFERKDRDGKQITVFKEELYRTAEAKALREAMYITTDSISLMDWLYEKTENIINAMQQYNPETWEDLQETAEYETINGEVDVYNSDRSEWLNSSLDTAIWVDQAVEELGHAEPASIFADIGLGQYKIIQELYENIINELTKLTEKE